MQQYALTALCFLLGALIAYYQYGYGVRNGRAKVNLFLCFIRTIVFFLSFLLLLNPNVIRVQEVSQRPKLSVLVDNSSSIRFFKKDSVVRDIVNNFKTHKALNDRFDIVYYSFGENFRLMDSLNFDAHQTKISEPIQQIQRIYKNANNAIVLLSDGNQTLGSDYTYSIRSEPVFAILVGDTLPHQDIEITQVNANKYGFIDNEFPVETLLNYDGEKPVRLRYSIEKKGKEFFSKELDFDSEKNSHFVSTMIQSSEVGPNLYTAKIQSLQREKNSENNSKNFSVEILDTQSKVLVLSSFLHPDLGALKRAIESNNERKATISLIDDDLKISDYQVIILYQPTDKFSKIMDELKDRKGSFFLITGSKTDWLFLNKMALGVSKNTTTQLGHYSANFNEEFSSFSQKDIGFTTYPPLMGWLGKITPSTPNQVLLFQNTREYSSQEPLLFIANNANQKRIFLLGEGIWKWRAASYINSNSFAHFDAFMDRLIQYASIKAIKNRLDVDANPSYNAGSSIQIQAYYVDDNFEFDDRATLFFLLAKKGSKQRATHLFSLSDNFYQLKLNDLESGVYEYQVNVKGQDISKTGQFTVDEFRQEEQFTSANEKKLEKIASRTQGGLFYERTHEQLIGQLLSDNRFKPYKESVQSFETLIDWQWIMVVIMSLLSIEWLTRKYFGKA